MFGIEEDNIVFRKTLKQVVKDLEALEIIDVADLKETLLAQFDRYSYDGEDEVVGFEHWGDVSQDGNYELQLKINHEDAYLFTIYVEVKNKLFTVTNVL